MSRQTYQDIANEHEFDVCVPWMEYTSQLNNHPTFWFFQIRYEKVYPSNNKQQQTNKQTKKQKNKQWVQTILLNDVIKRLEVYLWRNYLFSSFHIIIRNRLIDFNVTSKYWKDQFRLPITTKFQSNEEWNVTQERCPQLWRCTPSELLMIEFVGKFCWHSQMF
jgi:hypothetical protein